MSSHPFFIESEQIVLSYEELYSYVSAPEPSNGTYKGANPKDYLKALIKAICCNTDFVILDLDFTRSEIDELIGDIELDHGTENHIYVNNQEELVSNIKNSDSKITLFTSGTTGVPKKVTHSISNLIRQVRQGDRYKEDKWALAYNPTHIAGIQVIFQALLNKNPMIYVFHKTRSNAMDLISRNQVTHISATPTYYRLLFGEDQTMDQVRRVSIGGEKSGDSLHQKLKRMFPNARINNIYASTEAGTLLASNGENFVLPDEANGKVRIMENQIYLHKDILGEASQLTLSKEEWYATGDRIEWVDQSSGLFRILGRVSEMINVGGNKVNPSEVEEAMERHKSVVKARVFGKPNSVLGNILMSEVVSANTNLTDLELKTFLADLLQPFKIPRVIKFVEKINLSRTGKIERKN